jgi:hypothetical protein
MQQRLGMRRMAFDLRFCRGAERTRTADFLLAKQVLYQLSYRPSETIKSTCANTSPLVLAAADAK